MHTRTLLWLRMAIIGGITGLLRQAFMVGPRLRNAAPSTSNASRKF